MNVPLNCPVEVTVPVMLMFSVKLIPEMMDVNVAEPLKFDPLWLDILTEEEKPKVPLSAGFMQPVSVRLPEPTKVPRTFGIY